MLKDKPLIKLFRTTGNFYVYDVNKNVILNIDNEAYSFLEKDIESYNDGCIEPNTIKKLRKGSFLSSNTTKEIVHPSNELVPYYLDNNVKGITLQVTQQCNFRCEYCIYSGNYSNRAHSNKKMSISTAFKGIDFLIEHSKNYDEVIVGFYGGEPLLEFDFVKKCIEYAEEKADGKKVRFSMTTNGSLLNDKIISFLNEHDVGLTISLDGPKEIHDKHRKFAAGNGGTFNKVIENIINLEKKFPEYVKRILFNAVIDTENDFSCVDKFFINYESIKDINMISSLISNKYTNTSIRVSKNYNSEKEYELFKIFYYKTKKKEPKNCSRIIMQEYFRIAKFEKEMLPTKMLPEKMHHGGPCIPGAQRLFMNVEGFFYPCEKASETSQHMRIGHIDTGFDVEKVREILNMGKVNEDACKNCWAIRLCGICAPYIDNTKEFSVELKAESCKTIKASLEERLKNYCVSKELGCSFQEEEFNHSIQEEKEKIFKPEC